MHDLRQTVTLKTDSDVTSLNYSTERKEAIKATKSDCQGVKRIIFINGCAKSVVAQRMLALQIGDLSI